MIDAGFFFNRRIKLIKNMYQLLQQARSRFPNITRNWNVEGENIFDNSIIKPYTPFLIGKNISSLYEKYITSVKVIFCDFNQFSDGIP